MSKTTIEWTQRPGTIGETLNPTTGCNKVDRGCRECYAEIMHRRLQAMGLTKYKQDFLNGAVMHWDVLEKPYAWTKPRTVFVDSMSDLFHDKVSKTFISDFFQVAKETPQHTYLVLTKRPENALAFWNWRKLRGDLWECPPNVWMGTSVNNQESADIRIPILMQLDGCLRFLSYEPATGPLNLRRIYFSTLLLDALEGAARLHWVIAGGESGPKAVASNGDWFRHVRDQCKATGTPFFFKQWGLWRPEPLSLENTPKMVKQKDKSYNVLDMQTWQQFPEPKTAAS